jgi:hypothetical protein
MVEIESYEGGVWDLPIDDEGLRLVRIACSVPEAFRMRKQGWTVERVAEALPGYLDEFSRHPEISKIWIANAKRLLEKEKSNAN